MTKFAMSRSLVDEMVAHCLAERPNEACGILAAKDGAIVKVICMRNASASPVRYSLDPTEQFAMYRALDENGWELGGVFHSHTRTEPLPSPTDVREASEAVPYLIVSLAADPPVVRAWQIVKRDWFDDNPEVTEIPFTPVG